MSDEKKPAPISFEHLGGRQISGVPEESSEPTDFSHIGGRCIFPASDAPEEKDGDAE
jgi:hypothetical protein